MLFDRQVRVAFEEEHVVEHMIGAGDRLVDVAELERDDLVDVAVVAVVVNARLVGCARLSSGEANVRSGS